MSWRLQTRWTVKVNSHHLRWTTAVNYHSLPGPDGTESIPWHPPEKGKGRDIPTQGWRRYGTCSCFYAFVPVCFRLHTFLVPKVSERRLWEGRSVLVQVELFPNSDGASKRLQRTSLLEGDAFHCQLHLLLLWFLKSLFTKTVKA